MDEFWGRQIGQLSEGQRQRVFLARAVARNPRLLLLDEPMASIDPEAEHSFYEMLAEIRKRMAVVLVSHDVGVISSHGASEGALEKLEDTYKCPVEMLAHGVPHRVLKRHFEDDTD